MVVMGILCIKFNVLKYLFPANIILKVSFFCQRTILLCNNNNFCSQDIKTNWTTAESKGLIEIGKRLKPFYFLQQNLYFPNYCEILSSSLHIKGRGDI